MARAHSKLNSHLLLANLAAAVTSTQAGAAKTNSRLAQWVSGLLYVLVAAIDVASLDESYSFQLKGRVGSGAYNNLHTALLLGGSSVVGAVGNAAGLYVVDVDKFYPDMKLDVTIGGTTPSIQYGCWAVARDFVYAPDAGTVITN